MWRWAIYLFFTNAIWHKNPCLMTFCPVSLSDKIFHQRCSLLCTILICEWCDKKWDGREEEVWEHVLQDRTIASQSFRRTMRSTSSCFVWSTGWVHVGNIYTQVSLEANNKESLHRAQPFWLRIISGHLPVLIANQMLYLENKKGKDNRGRNIPVSIVLSKMKKSLFFSWM